MQVTRIELPPLPEHVTVCLTALRRAGGRCWLVGGAVRDLLLGLQPEDFDVATDLPPDRVAPLFVDSDLREATFGTVRIERESCKLTITTLRREADYRDQRHPERVEFVTDIAVDARRRDFTVNALYFDPATGELCDPTGGVNDLDARRLRTIGPPEQRFGEDPLRLLRLVRFAVAKDLDVDNDTVAGAEATATALRALSPERCYDELTRTFTGPGRGRSLDLLVALGIADVVLPEVPPMHGVAQPPEYHPEGDVLTHVGMVLAHVPAGDPVLAWSAVLHDIGKPATYRVAADRIRFDGHDTLSAQMAETALRRLRAPRAVRERVVDICLQHIRFAAFPQMRPAKAERWLRDPVFPQHLAFHRADCLASHGKLDIWQLARDRLTALPPVHVPLLTGKDVLALGIAPGPEVGELLRAIEGLCDESPVATTREQALVLLRDRVERLRQG